MGIMGNILNAGRLIDKFVAIARYQKPVTMTKTILLVFEYSYYSI